MEKKYQCFISSTYCDLVEERKEVYSMIYKMKHFPVGMEYFNAANESQWDIIKRIIDSSDYYIIIVGHRYGSIVEDEDISYTEKEYDYAKSRGIPILRFILDRNHPVSQNFVESGEQKIKLDKFIEKIKTERMVAFWDTPKKLSGDVALALFEAINNNPRDGWVRFTKHIQHLEEVNSSLLIENTQLKNELLGLKSNASQSSQREPFFELLFDTNDSDQLNIVPYCDNSLETIAPLIPESTVVPALLIEYCTENEIKKYNEKIPEVNKRIVAYNKEVRAYNQQICGQQIFCSIHNKGKALATNIEVEFLFPEDFTLRHTKRSKKLKQPQHPTIPTNPIAIATKKIKESKHVGSRMFERFGSISPQVNFIEQNFSHEMGILYSTNLRCSGKNEASFSEDKLLHGYKVTISELEICPPLETKSYTGIARIHCAELAEPQQIEFTINVEFNL